jgi:hypothetical protein
VRKAADIKEVFTQFYNIIYSTETTTLADTVVPQNGELEVPFTIPLIGVEEVNIIINMLNAKTRYSLYQPDGSMVNEADLNNMRITAKTFSIIKIPAPTPGMWKLVVNGIPSDQIKIDMVYNAYLQLITSVNGGNHTAQLNAQTEITAQYSQQGVVIDDKNIYINYPMEATVTNGGKTNTYPLTFDVQRRVAQCTFETRDYGIYEVEIHAAIDGIRLKSEEFSFEVINNGRKECEGDFGQRGVKKATGVILA